MIFRPLRSLGAAGTIVGMDRKKPRAPQEKKALSYARDRRNTYRENDKASRKLIPLRKAQERRQGRRKVAQELAILPNVEEAPANLIESSARHDIHRVGGWTKSADAALGEVVAAAMKARDGRAGRKARNRSTGERS